MNRFLKKYSPWLGLPGLALLMVMLAFIFRPASPGYEADGQKIVSVMKSPSKRIGVRELSGKQLIDIRPANLFAQGHPENAINIPLRQLLEKESLNMLDKLTKDGRQAVLFGTDELQATAPWLLLQQLGYENVLLLKGGAGSDGELKETVVPLAEISVVDTSAFRAAKEAMPPAENQTVTKKATSVIPVRREAAAGGGC